MYLYAADSGEGLTPPPKFVNSSGLGLTKSRSILPQCADQTLCGKRLKCLAASVLSWLWMRNGVQIVRTVGRVFTHGGRTPTGLDAIAWAQQVESLGAGELLLTSMDRDGTQAGYDLELTRRIADAVRIPVIASGGVGSLEHLHQGLATGGADAVLAASIFHFGEHTVGDAKAYLHAHGGGTARLQHLWRSGMIPLPEALRFSPDGLVPAIVRMWTVPSSCWHI